MLVAIGLCLVGIAFAQEQQPQFKNVMLPTFLKGASDECKQASFQFINTVTDTSLNRQEKDEQVEQLMETQPDNVKTAFEQYRQQVAEHAKEFADMVGDKIDAMPPQARRAANKLHFIETNPNLSQQERNDRAKAFFEALPANVQDEIKQMRGSLPPRMQPQMTLDH